MNLEEEVRIDKDEEEDCGLCCIALGDEEEVKHHRSKGSLIY